ncbi:MAG: glycine zipper family protein [Planctomycetes bacterium]|nr:glycine zipper family protein [Planctomycetota bacterium]
MRLHRYLIAFALLATLASPALALTTDEVIRLSQAGVSDPVIVNQIRASGSTFELSADDILRLKEAKVSDEVLTAMIQTRRAPAQPAGRTGGAAQPAANEPKPEPAVALPPRGEAQRAVAMPGEGRQGSIELVNADDRMYSFNIDAESRTIYVYYGDGRERVNLEQGETRSLAVAPGDWFVRWVGENPVYRATVDAGETTRIVTKGTDVAGVPGVAVEVIRRGNTEEGGTLKKFGTHTTTATRVDQVVRPSTTVVYTPPAPTTVYVERTYVPTTTCVNRSFYDNYWGDYRSTTTCVSGYRSYGTTYYGPSYTSYRSERHSSPTWLPGGRTLVGAGIGAIIGHQYRERGKGAAIGAGVGYLLDQVLRR